jgi:hypothetical protein
MCISREHFNLCECGCPEIVHEEEYDCLTVIMHPKADEYLPFATRRGKCLGDVPLPLSVEEVQKLVAEAKERGETKITITKPCDCKKFVPIFKPMCTGFGA